MNNLKQFQKIRMSGKSGMSQTSILTMNSEEAEKASNVAGRPSITNLDKLKEF